MSQQLNKAQNDYLWMAIIGLSNHYLQQHIEHSEYTKLALEYRREVSKKNSAVYRPKRRTGTLSRALYP